MAMDSCPEIWNVLHDATLVGATGIIPGTVSLKIECDYLRERFAVSGDHFALTLDQCAKFQFRPWDDGLPIVTDLEAIATSGLWILSADRTEEHCKIHCTFTGRSGGGILEIAAASAALHLDSGEPVQLGEIISVAESYWKEWSHRGIVQQAKEIAKKIVARELPPQDGSKLVCDLQSKLDDGDHALDGFVYWDDEYVSADIDERRDYCRRAILQVAKQLLDDNYPGGPNWDENAPSESV